jgi:hypothetical protein
MFVVSVGAKLQGDQGKGSTVIQKMSADIAKKAQEVGKR